MANQLMDPVDGVTLEMYGHGCAWLTRGATKDDVVKALGIDMPLWDKAEAEWKARMAADKSFSVTMAFSNAYTGAPQMPSGSSATVEKSDLDPTTFPFEKYVEAMVAQDVLGKMGRDAQDVLKDFGMSVADYSNVSAYYSQRMMMDFSLAAQMQALMNQYKAKYESMKTDSHSDLEF